MSLDLRNCPNCGRLFAKKPGVDLCPVCLDTEEEDFQKVKSFLWDYPNSTIEVVHEKTGVSRERIIKFIRDDRLIAEGLTLDYTIECERCGTLIPSGRFCKKCQDELVKGLSPDKDRSQQVSNKRDEKSRMHLYDRIHKRGE
ncbi:MAG TPA: flagellar protein [Halanaerobiaceae bacterium]|jgi:flagellar operon protein (TIGR03826 family)|nr:flagellar protein [Halanaerobiaceae bacterium]